MKKPPQAPAGVTLTRGRVVASHGSHLTIEDGEGHHVPCRLHGRRLSAVCGDEVRWGYAPGEATGLVGEVLPRRTVLARLSMLGAAEPVVANLSQVAVVAAAVPAPDWFVIDRYLAAAAWAGLQALVVFNKVDLGVTESAAEELTGYQALGYPVVRTSSRGDPGTADLAAALSSEVSVLVGQSGTGKSSLLNVVLPDARALTQEISTATEEGRHTTTHAVLHHLAGGGELIDSPGVRDYAPPLPELRQVSSGFVEIAALGTGCRFQDCLHSREPGCAVREALAAGGLRTRRYDSYRHLLTLAREMHERFPNRRKDRKRSAR